MTTPRVVHVVVPVGVDDPILPSGGNVYDRRLCEELERAGRQVVQTTSLASVPDSAVALVDGLVAVADPGQVERSARRLPVVALQHMAFGERSADARPAEERVLSAVRAVVATSAWSRRWLLEAYVPSCPVHVAAPGVDPADVAPGSSQGERLLCVAAVTPDKGHDQLLTALAGLLDLPWTLTCAGSLGKDRTHADLVQRLATDLGLGGRVTWTGALDRDELDKTYATADVTVLASRAESWAMVVTESLARGLPVVATDVGGLSEALGSSLLGRPGLLVPAGDAGALARALRRWLSDPGLRVDLRSAARARRTTLTGWSVTARKVSDVLAEAAR